MKPKNLIRPVLASTVFGMQIASLSAQSDDYPDGFLFDAIGETPGTTILGAWSDGANRRSVMLGAGNGSVQLYSGIDGTLPDGVDGGILIQGNPVSILLSSSNPLTPNNGDFRIFSLGSWPSSPLLNINGQTGNTTFTNSNVSITGGTLTVGGSPVITSSTASTVLTAGGFVNTSNFNSTLSAATPPTSSAWTAAFVPRGNVAPASGSSGGVLAMGSSSASGDRSIASGYTSVASGMLSNALGTSVTASGQFATAVGQNSTASGMFSLAVGNNVHATAQYAISQGQNSTASFSWAFARGYETVASGMASNAMGYGVSAKARAETAFGDYNIESVVSSGVISNGLYGLFRVGNGNSTTRSDALTVQRNGQTTLTNKEWKAAVVADPATALADPASTTDSSGNALVVDGHAVLNGKVTLAVAQGDISMGDYQ